MIDKKTGFWAHIALKAIVFAALGILSLPLALSQKSPTPLEDHAPKRIILGYRGDPATSQAVTWRTDHRVDTPQGQIAPLTASPDFERTAATVAATAKEIVTELGKSIVHYLVDFQRLRPATAYSYRVGDGNTWSEWNTIRTADSKEAPFRFIYLGDAQNGIKSLWSRTIRAAYAAAPDARFFALAGDLVTEGYDDNLWGELCAGMGFLSQIVPLLPTPGNHDLHRPPGDADSKTVLMTSALWGGHFALPLNGPADAPELRGEAYFVDYQGLRLISLDANPYANEDFDPSARKRVSQQQTAWLREVLANNPNRWTIVLQHQSLFSIATGRDYAEMRAALMPVYDQYHVDLVLQGHDHAYGRTEKIYQGKVVPFNAQGTIYAISVSGSKMYPLGHAFDPLMAKTLEGAQLYQLIEIQPSQLNFKAFKVDGTLVDEFTLSKPAKQ